MDKQTSHYAGTWPLGNRWFIDNWLVEHAHSAERNCEVILRGTLIYFLLFLALRFFLNMQAGAIGIPALYGGCPDC